MCHNNQSVSFPAAKLVPVGYGIKKLQIGCVVEDEKVSRCQHGLFVYRSSCCLTPSSCLQVGTDILEERISAFEDFIQSMDVAAFNKI